MGFKHFIYTICLKVRTWNSRNLSLVLKENMYVLSNFDSKCLNISSWYIFVLYIVNYDCKWFKRHPLMNKNAITEDRPALLQIANMNGDISSTTKVLHFGVKCELACRVCSGMQTIYQEPLSSSKSQSAENIWWQRISTKRPTIQPAPHFRLSSLLSRSPVDITHELISFVSYHSHPKYWFHIPFWL